MEIEVDVGFWTGSWLWNMKFEVDIEVQPTYVPSLQASNR